MGYKLNKSTPPMERELNYLLNDLCVKWGFCIPPDNQIEISQAEYYTSSDFANDVISSDGMNPDGEKKWLRKISDKFIERFGTDEIDVSSFSDRIRGQKENW